MLGRTSVGPGRKKRPKPRGALEEPGGQAGEGAGVLDTVLDTLATDLRERLLAGAGEEGGHVVASGTPAEVAMSAKSRTAPYLASYLA